MTAVESLKQSILTECDEDHVGLWSVIRDVEDCFPKKDATAIRDQVLSLLRELLAAGEIKAGFPTKEGKFRALRTAPDKILERIEAEWPRGSRPTIGEGLWFTRVEKTGRRPRGCASKYRAVAEPTMFARSRNDTTLASAHPRPKKGLRK
jgi:hypothetical protein